MEIKYSKINPEKLVTLRAATAKKPRPNSWTAEQDTALIEGVNKYGLDFKRIQGENDILGVRTLQALEKQLSRIKPEKLIELKRALPPPAREWSPEQIAALTDAVEKHGCDFELIKKENPCLKLRTTYTLDISYSRIYLEKYKKG
ncbi:hypothetical protein TL16_g11215 [Triparma laevis f. inornata]|uniref:Myb-like domain-containing protein n=1 Tax=Triparma laevis f. inornata TaxID=1714386 RepID=A0A9W7BD71_9STRA|nr:hypothetical protein TL16_g11215 [Triparma laevis f. inornata]